MFKYTYFNWSETYTNNFGLQSIWKGILHQNPGHYMFFYNLVGFFVQVHCIQHRNVLKCITCNLNQFHIQVYWFFFKTPIINVGNTCIITASNAPIIFLSVAHISKNLSCQAFGRQWYSSCSTWLVHVDFIEEQCFLRAASLYSCFVTGHDETISISVTQVFSSETFTWKRIHVS